MKITTTFGIALLAGAGFVATGCDNDEPRIETSPTTQSESPAVSGMSQQARAFEVLDQDRDGYLSELEAQDRVKNYGDADSNDDGRLDRSEFSMIEMK